jgi:carboxymethylenebutenolidase
MPPHYIALPKGGKGPGLLVLHSWWGLNSFFRSLCDRFAAAGFVALAPDLYDGRVARTVAAARKLRAEATAARRVPAYKSLIAAIDHLVALDATAGERIGIAGFSMGGHWALWLAQREELPISAAVVFYAARNGNFRQSRSRFQFHLACHDEWVSAASVKKMKASLAGAGRPAEYFEYPGVGHWFFEADRPEAYCPSEADLAWRRTLEFLKAP